MKAELVEQASKIIPEPQMLINVVSRRVAQLNNGRAPLVPTTPHMGYAAGNHVDQHLGLGNDFGGLFDEFGFHVKRSR